MTTDEKPWTTLPMDIELVPYCEKHHMKCEVRKIDDIIGYGFFCPKCHPK